MPSETLDAIKYVLLQGVDVNNHIELVTSVRNYFNENNIKYETFDFNDLKPYL